MKKRNKFKWIKSARTRDLMEISDYMHDYNDLTEEENEQLQEIDKEVKKRLSK